jgi:RNase P/RNase MRP subunit p30
MKLKKIKSKSGIIDSCDGYLIDADEKVARAIVASLKDKKFGGVVAVLGRSGGFNRRVVESLKIDYLVSPELGDRKDSLKQRDSGLNHIVAKEMAKRGIAVVVDFDSIASMNGKVKALRLARIMQNVKICRRAGCKVRILGSADEKALKSFGFGIEMSSVQVAEAVA